MSLRIANVRVRADEPEAALPDRLARLLGLKRDELLHWRILRKALDYRDKDALQYVYTAEVTLPDEAARVARLPRSGHPKIVIEPYTEEPFVVPPPGAAALAHRPVVIGSGPGG